MRLSIEKVAGERVLITVGESKATLPEEQVELLITLLNAALKADVFKFALDV